MPSRKRNQGKARKAKAAAASIAGSKEQSSSAQRQESTPPGENNDIVISGGLRLNHLFDAADRSHSLDLPPLSPIHL